MPHWLFMTIINTGSSWPGRVLQIMHVAKSPSLDPASPPTTTVTAVTTLPLLDQRRPGSHRELDLDHRTDRHDVPLPQCDSARRSCAPCECGSVSRTAACRTASTIGMSIAKSVARLR